MKRTSLFHSGLGPDTPTVTLHNVLDSGHTNTCAFVFGHRMQPLKPNEKSIGLA